MDCRTKSWIAAILLGVAVFVFTAVLGDLGTLAGLLLGALAALLLGSVLVWGVCTGAGGAAENAAFLQANWRPEPFEPSRRVVAAGGAVVTSEPLAEAEPITGPARESVTLTPETGSRVAEAIVEGPPATLPEPEPQAEATPEPLALAGLHAAMGVPPLDAVVVAPAVEAANLADSTLEGDDLGRIKGIGPALTQWLHERGITRFEQIAAWSDAEVDHYAAAMPRMGHRIRSEDWVGQARILAAGGETEHSRQVDRGEAT